MPTPTLLVLRTADLARSRRFYETLGVVFAEEQHGAGPRHLAATLPSGLVLELYPALDHAPLLPGSPGDVRLGFAVADVAQVLDNLHRQGFPVSATTAVDPDGRRVSLTKGTL